MPRISKLLSMIIYMYADEHNPPHFHVLYNGRDTLVEIKSLKIIGDLPAKQKKAIKIYAIENREALLQNWMLLEQGRRPKKI